MLDRIKFYPDRLFLTSHSVNLTYTSDGFSRWNLVHGRKGSGTLVLSMSVDNYSLVRISAFRVRDGRWAVGRIDFNSNSLIHGHNGTLISTPTEFALALTRLRHIVSLVTEPHGHDRIVPGFGNDNSSYLSYTEFSVQIQDTDHRLLLASHLGRSKNQQKSNQLFPGESTRMRGRDLGLSFYDKFAKSTLGVAEPADIDGTRIEAIIRDAGRLAKEVKATGLYSGKPGKVVATLALPTAYAVHRQAVGRVVGFGWMADKNSLPSLSRTARMLVAGLGAAIRDPAAVCQTLDAYARTERPCERTLRQVRNEVRSYAVSYIAPDAMGYFPADPDQLLRSHVRWPHREDEFRRLMDTIGAPSQADPEIAAAWATTTFLPEIPASNVMTGTVGPARSPWLNTTI